MLEVRGAGCRGAGRTVAVIAAIVGLGTLAAAPLSASPISDKQAQAQRLEAQINSTGDRIAALGERYDGAVLAADDATKAIADSEQRLAAAQSEWNLAKVALGRKAAALYLAASQQTPMGDVDVASVTDLMSRSRYTAAVQDRDRALMGTISAARQDLETRRRNLQAARVQAERQRDTLLQTRKDLEGENAHEASLLSQVKGDLARLVAEQRARDEAAARARAAAMAARLANGSGHVANGNGHGRPAPGPATFIGPDTPIPNVPPPSTGAALAVAYARAQLGKPYVYDTAGPDTFDCSGLSMMAWAAAGVSMPHYSGAQFAMFPHVPLGALQPGDLVFKGPGGSEHVAIYVGNGMQIAATHTGSYVLLQPVDYAGLSGAVRP